MRIRPKNPRALKLRRVALGAAGFAVVVIILLLPRGAGKLEEETDTAEQITVELPEGEAAEGELDWEYPPGWIDFSDLPPREELGDEDRPGLGNWRYLLVNGLSQNNYLREAYYPQMSHVENGYSFQTRAHDDLVNFLMDARAQGYTVSIGRTFMAYADQRIRFNGMASTIHDRDGISLADAEKQVIAMGYYPGADEHQTGLAVNFVDEEGNAKFSTPVLQWMTEHCAEYGFILRYPEGKEEITGRSAEPGHYRYVGQLAAEYIMRKGITLEEFLNAYEEDAEVVWNW